MHPASPHSSFIVRFVEGGAASSALMLPIPVLAGCAEETIFDGLQSPVSRDGFQVYERDGVLVGTADETAEADLTEQTRRMYQRMLRIVDDRRLARVWNYVPRINENDTNGLENYRAFCRGRSLAFEEHLGDGYRAHLPAASAVGGADGRLTMIFAATRAEPRHVENPDQVPAYEYPPEHGPRPPSFARATRVEDGGRRYVFVSGTAAIKGHATVAAGDLGGQIACTLDNLRLVSRACGLGDRLGKDSRSAAGWTRHFKVYLRHASDYPRAVKLLDGALFAPGDRVTWLRSDICRAALLIEIEATLVSG